MNRIEKLKRFLQENHPNIQAFNTENLVGDYMELVYDEDDIEVYYCYGWEYIEIFGLSQAEFDSLIETDKWGSNHLKTFTFKEREVLSNEKED